ncbi:MAG: dTDP-4-dehydrorhamnose reductase [Segetibacter sp.]
MMNGYSRNGVEIWAGIECSYNRVDNNYMDQLNLSGHYERSDDIPRIAALGFKALRYPILWEKHAPQLNIQIDWKHSRKKLEEIKEAGVEPIVGLVHHGSGPVYADFYDGSFAKGLAAYAASVANQFPWITYYTPVNEPLTTARFCGLYGHWYPHGKTSEQFLKILIEECRATVLSMLEIRKVNPNAKLIQTEDLGKTHSTKELEYQADFENERRWLSIDLLCGTVNQEHRLWKYLIDEGISPQELTFFVENPCPPYIIGINHYLTSERYIDQRIANFPPHTIGGNCIDTYADVEAVRVAKNIGTKGLLRELWERFSLPIAITEVHLHCGREEQLRWFLSVWKAANELKEEGADIRAVTAWAILGSFDWCSLLTNPGGIYEPGLFDVRSPTPRLTALAKLVKALANGKEYHHPVLEEEGWWKRPCAVIYNLDEQPKPQYLNRIKTERPLIIIGKTGTLGRAMERIYSFRGIHNIVLGRDDLDIANEREIAEMIRRHKPWAIINTAGYVRVDDAEKDADNCFLINTKAPELMSRVCERQGVQFVTFSSDLVFDGAKTNPYLESDLVSPLNIYGQSKAMAEELVLKNNPSALIIRTSAFFGPWDQHNFVYNTLRSLQNNEEFSAAKDVTISPTYVPDLVDTTVDLLLDEANGIWNISNNGSISWATLAAEVAQRSGYNHLKNFKPVTMASMRLAAARPSYSVLNTEKGFELPSWEHALDRYFREQECLSL